jgi:molecular chaperone GrpE
MAKKKDTENITDETATTDVAQETTDERQEVTATEEAEVIENGAKVDAIAAEDTGEAKTETAVEELTLEEQLEQARQEAAANLDRWQRAAAELANFKRRQEEQSKLHRDRIKAEVLEGVISALDDMELAFQNMPQELDGQLIGWVEGFRLVQRKLDKTMEDQNVMPISTNGKFDPNFHQAVSYEESEEHEEGQIIGELRKGYQIGNRVIRPALVRVAK